MKCKECGQEIAPKKKDKQCPPHSFGEGYYHTEAGSRVLHTQICRNCNYRQDTKTDKEEKSKGPSIKGLSSGERFSR